ncbi:MMS19 nucleotide excision repair protein [Brevipalpus obovatus]|uniref:MMS19 nucleotide excision repair protein n=1 Tax=Brevipalpus obovatus TaxID=246614 RepID=UPI003D9F21B5
MTPNTGVHNLLGSYLQDQNSEDKLSELTAKTLIDEVMKKENPLVFLTECLESSLTATNIETRMKGAKILCQFVQQLSPDKIRDAEIDHLVRFLLSLFESNHVFIPLTIEAILFIVHEFGVQEELAITIFQVIGKGANLQQLIVKERFIVYQLIGLMFFHHRDAFKNMGSDFLYGFMQIIEGERDPRCLMLSLNLFAEVASTCSLGELDEEIFDVISCYFPIAYRPNRKKEIDITRLDLHLALKKCFKANIAFGPHALSLIVDKLESEVESAKIDSYDMITECSSVYGANCLKPFIATLWTSIRIDVMKVNPGNLTEKAIEALKSILVTIEDHEETRNDLMKEIFKDMETALTNVSLILTKSAASVLAAMTLCSKSYLKLVVDTIFPLILNHWIFNNKKSNREFIDEFTTFFKTWHKANLDLSSEKFACQESILLHLLAIFESDDDLHQISSLECLTNFLECKVKWDANDCISIAKALLLLSTSESNERVRSKAFATLHALSSHHTEIADEFILSRAIDGLCDTKDFDGKNLPEFLQRIKILSRCKLLLKSVEKLLAYFASLLQTSDDCCASFLSPLTDFVVSLIDHDSRQIFVDRILARILPKHLKGEIISAKRNHSLTVIKRILPVLNSSDKSWVLDQLISSINSSVNSIESDQLNTSFLLLSFLPLDFDHNWNPLQELFSKSLEKENLRKNPHFLNSCVALLNKLPEKFSSNFSERLKSVISDSSDCNESIQLLVGCNRGLVLRGGQLFSLFIDDLIKILGSSSDRKALDFISTNFVPSIDVDEFLSPVYGGQVSPLYAQKYFYHTLNPLLKGYSDSTDIQKHYFALCLLGLFKNLPKSLMRDEIVKFQSIIILRLDGADDSLSASIVLDCLCIMIEMDSAVLSRNLNGIINQLLRLGKNNPYLIIRQKSLECLIQMAKSMNSEALIPEQPRVIRSLKEILGDKKRLVRSACSKALQEWLLLTQLA